MSGQGCNLNVMAIMLLLLPFAKLKWLVTAYPKLSHPKLHSLSMVTTYTSCRRVSVQDMGMAGWVSAALPWQCWMHQERCKLSTQPILVPYSSTQ